MIPKPLEQIEWADLEVLRDSGREESDTIEFKSSFSGGDDFLNFSDAQREKAVKGIAREAIAFLNTRGGDILIGAEEDAKSNPRIKNLRSIPNVREVADRIAQSLASIIEPQQSVLGVRAVTVDNSGEGILIVRAPQSLRAPHRFARDKECYARRGRETVAMPMDEIQEMAVRKHSWRSERLAMVERMFNRFTDGVVRRETVSGARFQIRIAYASVAAEQIAIDDPLLCKIFQTEPRLAPPNDAAEIEDSFRKLGSWKHVLRGRAQTTSLDYGDGDRLILVGREIREDSSLIFDGAWRVYVPTRTGSDVHEVVPKYWVDDFLANCLWSVRELVARHSESLPGYLVVRTNCVGLMKLGLDSNGHQLAEMNAGLVALEPFEILEPEDLNAAFQQLQRDVCAMAERVPKTILSFAPCP